MRYAVNDDWTINVAHMADLDAEGVFFSDPNLGDYEIQRFDRDTMEDEFHNTNWTVEGRVGSLEVLATELTRTEIRTKLSTTQTTSSWVSTSPIISATQA